MHYSAFVVFPLLTGMAQALVRRYDGDSAYPSKPIETPGFMSTFDASFPTGTAVQSIPDGCSLYASSTYSAQFTCYSTGIPAYTAGVQYQTPQCYSTISGSFNSAGLPVAPTVMPCFAVADNGEGNLPPQNTAWQFSGNFPIPAMSTGAP